MKIDPDDFISFILLYLGHHLKKKTEGSIIAPFHDELCQCTGSKFVAIAAPRGFGKSNFLSFFYPLYVLLNFPDTKVIIASNTHALAQHWSLTIRRELESNERIKIDFGEQLSKDLKWNNDLFELPNGSSLRSRGYGQQIRGLRPDLFIGDDLETDEMVVNPILRDKFDKWFAEEVMGSLLPESRAILIGTILDPDSFLANMFSKDRYGWDTRFFQAIVNGESIWKEMWPLEELELKRKADGEYAFQQEFMNNPVPAEFRKFQRHWFKYYTELPPKCNFFMAIDLAIKTGDKNDYTAMIVAAMDQFDNMYIVAYKRARMLPKETVDFLFQYYERYNISKIGIEEVGFQEMLIHDVKDQRTNRGLYPNIVPLKSGGRRKGLRIEALQPRFECGKIFFKEGMDELETEFLRYPSRCHDDLIDAMAYLLHIIYTPSRTKKHINPNSFGALLEQRKRHSSDDDYFN